MHHTVLRKNQMLPLKSIFQMFPLYQRLLLKTSTLSVYMTVNPAYITVPTKTETSSYNIFNSNKSWLLLQIGSFSRFLYAHAELYLVHALLIVPSLLQTLQLLKDIALIIRVIYKISFIWWVLSTEMSVVKWAF